MRVQECYFNSGQKTGDSFEGSVDECAEFLMELDTEDDEDHPKFGQSLNDWTQEEAVKELTRCLAEREALYIDGAGDRQWWLIVTD